MKISQLPKYHVNRKKWEAARVARGLPADEAALDALKLRTIGRVCSSKAFTQKELDAMLAAFLATSEPANFDAQMGLQGQPELRASAALRRIGVLKYHLQLKPGLESAYVAGISRRLFGTDQYQNLNDVQAAQLEGIIVRRLLQIYPKDRVDEFLNGATEHAVSVDSMLTAGKFPGDPF